MVNNRLSFTIETNSNLFIGGSPTTFEIGGVDAYTVVDYEGSPYIPGSSLKGILRFIAKENWQEIETGGKIQEAYLKYLNQLKEKLELEFNSLEMDNQERNKMNKRFEELTCEVSPEFLFGIEGFNQTPKLLFSDVVLAPNQKYPDQDFFSLDSKNAITVVDQDMTATPRTYKTVRPGVIFQGEILFQRMGELGVEPKMIEEFIESCSNYLSDGFYRLGNSGSRGYGRVKINFAKGD